MKTQITSQGLNRSGDTVSVWDNDNREIAIRRNQVDALIKLLLEVRKRDYGQLAIEYTG